MANGAEQPVSESETTANNVRLAFCEPVWASTSTYEHIRQVDGPLKPGGGIVGAALCGFDVTRGWDIPGDVTAERIARGLDTECNPTCPKCAAVAVHRHFREEWRG